MRRSLTLLTNSSFSRVNVWNEWDPLEEVVVGVPTNAVVPKLADESKTCIDPQYWSFFQKNSGKLLSDALGATFWDNLLNEHNTFMETLKKFDLKVMTPQPQNFGEKYILPNNYETSGFFCGMPRDILLVVGNRIIEAPMTWRSRYFEINAYRDLIYEYYFPADGQTKPCDWVVCPKPTYKNIHEITDEGDTRSFISRMNEITFDAADFIKAGTDLFVQKSEVTNELGIEWVRRTVADMGINVVELSFEDPRPMHIDGTFVLLKPGLILVNSKRPCHQQNMLEKAGWKFILCPPRTQNNIPYYLGSPWLSMNLLSLRPDLLIAEEGDKELREVLNKQGIEVVPVPFRHCNAIGGSFHCWTVDIRRKGSLLSYSNW